MSMKGCWAIDSVCPLKLQNTWLSGYCPFVWFTIETSSTWVAAGMALTLPQKEVGGAPEPLAFTVQLNEADPAAPVVSLAVTVTVEVLAVVGVPVIRPDEEIDSPAGRPVALKVSVWPEAESVAAICWLTAVPTVDVWLPGLVTVTVLPPEPPVPAKTLNSQRL